MALTQYTADTDIIETLGTNPEDRPTLTDNTFKGKFDENAANIKAFLNAMIAELASTANGKGASQIGIEDSAGRYTATQIEAALAEIAGSGRTTETVKGLADLISTHTAETVFYLTDASRNIATTGVQTITLPFLAKKIEIIALVNGTKQWSQSFRVGSLLRNVFQLASVSNMYVDGNYDIILNADGTNVANGTVQNITATGFEVNWTKVGAPTGTATLVISASTH